MSYKVQVEHQSIERKIPQAYYPDIKLFDDT